MRRSFKLGDEPSSHVLRPFDKREAISVSAAARAVGYSPAHMRRLVARYDLGRRIGGGNWKVSKAALRMFVENDAEALAAYHEGRRDDPTVRRYLDEVGAGLPAR